MRAQCLLCHRIDTINDDDPLAKRLRNRPIHTYTCPECYDRIAHKAKTRRGENN
ncbi:YlaI family protein [Natribacillus halophilus]|uniref:YlaI family protein n=1 Tax=Natribacillus halophilus TaxID=549003 RepID=UPI000B8364EE